MLAGTSEWVSGGVSDQSATDFLAISGDSVRLQLYSCTAVRIIFCERGSADPNTTGSTALLLLITCAYISCTSM